MGKRLAFERLVTKITKENLWLYISKMLLDRPMYAYEISKNVTARFGFSIATITVYVVLYKMQREGLIRIREIATLKGKPTRKYYELTDEGQQCLLKGAAFLQDVVHALS